MNDSKSGSNFQIQISQTRGAVTPEANTEDFVEATEERLKQVSELIRKGCANVAENLFSIPNPPAEIAMEFGVDVGGEAGIPFVTKGTINANFKVSVTWQIGSNGGDVS
ncbi:CU044_2847 family protein [Oricola sp.]|uniref:CU044_2847 family protein n=1 Tax=Oricola sp. TaxID=1979950 RepID=UPI003BA967A2